MYDRDFFAHTNPDGESPSDRFGPDLPKYCTSYGENIVMTYIDRDVNSPNIGTYHVETTEELAKYIVKEWMNSPPHKRNLLRESWDSEGVGIHIISEGDYAVVHATQNFCEKS
jgi:uncharacterized protein YkwD